MQFKAVMSNGPDIPIDNEADVKAIMEKIAMSKGLVMTKHGLLNPSFLISIVPDKQRMQELLDMRRYGQEYKEPPSEFARILGKKMTMLPDGAKSEAMVEASKDERHSR